MDTTRSGTIGRPVLLALLGVLAAVTAAYSVGFDGGFAGDDLDLLYAAVKTVHHPFYLLQAQTYFFRPAQQLFFVLCLLAGGTWFPVYLAGTLLLHLAATVLVAELGWSLTRSPVASLAAAAWWALLRFHAEVVLRPYAVADSIALAFGLLAFALLRRGRNLLALIAFVVAVGGKENAIVLPLVFALWAVLLPRGERRGWLRRLAPMAAVATADAAWGVLLRSGRSGYLAPGPNALTTLWENIGSWIGPDLHYLRHTVLASSRALIPMWLAAALTLVAVLLAFRASGRVRFALGWIVVTMLPTVFVPVQGARYQYVPTVGAALVLALMLAGLAGAPTRLRRAASAVVVGWLAVSVAWNAVGIRLEASDFDLVSDLHRRAAASFAETALPALTAVPDAVCLFLPADTMAVDREVVAAWGRHPWWAPTTQKWLYRRADGILGMTNTWAFVTWVAIGRAPDPLFVVARPEEVQTAAGAGRLVAVHHRLPADRFELAPPAVADRVASDPRFEDAWISFQPGRFDPTATGTAYP